MRTLLKSEDYRCAACFEREKQRIFACCWQFVGYTHQLAANNDWVTAEIAGTSVFVQNFEGRLRGYVNACSHRFSQIRREAAGNGKLQCPYHGWCYDQDGRPCAIPSKPRFDDLTPARISELSLRSIAVETIGPFIFARLAGEGVGLREWLGGAAARLEAIGAALGERLDTICSDIQANWKFVVENTLEGYHLHWVHEETFDRLELGYPRFEFFGPHAGSHFKASEKTLKNFEKVDARFQNRPFRNDGYYHLVIFPNFGIATLYGMTIAVQRFQPISPGRTRLLVDLFGTQLSESATAFDRSFYRQFCESSVEFSRKVCGEDQGIVEMQQRGVASREQDGILSDEEQRIAVFQNYYRRMLES